VKQRRLDAMRVSRLIGALFLLQGVGGSVIAAEEACDRSPRHLQYELAPENIYLDSIQPTEIVFTDEALLRGARADSKEGLIVSKSRLSNKIALKLVDTTATTLLRVEGDSGKTYLLNLLPRPGCADSLVEVGLPKDVGNPGTASGAGNVKSLMYYLIRGDMKDIPPGYTYKSFERNPLSERTVFESGAVQFVVQSQLVGRRYVGTTYEVINKGRTAVRVPIEDINYTNDTVKRALGAAKEIAMIPVARRLDPAPEFVSEAYTTTYRGLLFIVSERQPAP
jgi:hypothetical protein